MLHQKSLNLLFLVRLTVKAVWQVMLAVFFIILGVIPIFNYGSYKLLGLTPELFTAITHTARRLIPLAAVLPVVFLLNAFSGSTGRELLCLYTREKKCAIAFMTLLLPLCAAALPLFLVYAHYFDSVLPEFLKMAAAAILFYGLAYFLMFLTTSVAVTALLLLLYESYLIISVEVSPLNFVLFHPQNYDYAFTWIFLAVLGVFLMLTGELISKIRYSP